MTNKIQDHYDGAFNTWVKWPEGGFDVELRYLSMEGADRLVKACTKKEFDSKTHQRVEKIDNDKFALKLADLITGWTGLTAKKLRKLMPIKKDIKDDLEYECSPDNKVYLVEQVAGFSSFILESAKELHLRKLEKESADLKN